MSNPTFQAIVTKFLPVTNSLGSRIKATASAGSVTIPYPHELNSDEAHLLAATTLANKYEWLQDAKYRLVGGGLPSGTGNAFVIIAKEGV